MPITKLIPITEIDPPDTPMRVSMDDVLLAELRENMADIGMIHPLAVVERDGRYVIEDGHRRFTCASELGWPEVRCEVYHQSELASGAVMLAANRHREKPSAAEEALLFAEHISRDHLDESGACARFHVSPDYLGDRMRLLRGDRAIFDAVLARRIKFSVARELNKCDEEAHRRYLLDIAVNTGYSSLVIAKMVREWRQNTAPQSVVPVSPTAIDPPAPAPEYRQECCICGGHLDPWAMVNVMIHKRELEEIKRILQETAQPS